MQPKDQMSASERLRKAMEDAEKARNAERPDATATSFDTVKEKVAGDGTIVRELLRTAYLRYGFIKNAYDTIEVMLKSKTLMVLTLGLTYFIAVYWRFCKTMFIKISMDKETGSYNKKRGAAALAGLVFFTWFGIPFILRTSTEAVMIEGFSSYNTLLFSKPDLAADQENIWSVSSCTQYPCEGEVDTTEYRMTDSMWLDLKYLLTGRVSYDPGELKGAFNSEQNACNVRQYKSRIKVPFSITIPYILPRNGFYPNIIEANCDSVDSGNWQEILDRKRAQRKDLQTK